MTLLIGVITLVSALLYAFQVVSALDFARAQRLGLQEKPEDVDPVYSGLELNTARWDLVSLWTLPAAGLLMLVGFDGWPYLGLLGGGAYIDAGGREAAKVLGLKAGKVRVGSPSALRLALAVFAFLIFAGLVMIAASLAALG